MPTSSIKNHFKRFNPSLTFHDTTHWYIEFDDEKQCRAAFERLEGSSLNGYTLRLQLRINGVIQPNVVSQKQEKVASEKPVAAASEKPKEPLSRRQLISQSRRNLLNDLYETVLKDIKNRILTTKIHDFVVQYTQEVAEKKRREAAKQIGKSMFGVILRQALRQIDSKERSLLEQEKAKARQQEDSSSITMSEPDGQSVVYSDDLIRPDRKRKLGKSKRAKEILIESDSEPEEFVMEEVEVIPKKAKKRSKTSRRTSPISIDASAGSTSPASRRMTSSPLAHEMIVTEMPSAEKHLVRRRLSLPPPDLERDLYSYFDKLSLDKAAVDAPGQPLCEEDLYFLPVALSRIQIKSSEADSSMLFVKFIS